jgi:hypothetical protein
VVLNVVPALIVVGLLVYAAIDCLQTPAGELRLGRGLWLTVIVLLPVLGPVAWLVLGRITAPRHARVEGAPEPAARPSGPVGPDDDPEFLAGLRRPQHRRPPETPPSIRPETRPATPPKPTGKSGEPVEPIDPES